ncbi:MAG TPA: hypothetical protein VEC99_17200, partial [Clostridia bacterium]|nr:hypothetical protein [Clostridia bacterium]
ERGWIGYLDRTMAHYRVHSSNTWNDRPADYKLRAMERMAWYLLEKVNEGSKDHWRDTILALSFKDVVLATKSMSLMRAGERLNHFIKCALKFRKPFWVFTRLWPYLRAYYFAK